MDSGKATGTGASAQMLAASQDRDVLTIMLYDDTSSVAIGIGEAAVADEGIVLREIGSSVTLKAHAARKQINIIGNGGIVTYQTGRVAVTAAANSNLLSSGRFTNSIGRTWAQFTASDKSYLTIADADQTGLDIGSDDYLISFWIYLDSADVCSMFSKYSGGGFDLYTDAARKFKLYHGDSTGYESGNSNTALTLSTWHHVVVYVDRSGDAQYYLDGVADGAFDVSARYRSVDNIAALRMGNGLDARLDSLMYFRAADLSGVAADIIAATYNGGDVLLCSDLTSAQKAAWGAVSGWDKDGEPWIDSWGSNDLTPVYGNIIEPATFGSEGIANGGFESPGSGDDFTSWTESASDGAIEEEGTIAHGGSHSCKVTCGATTDVNAAHVQSSWVEITEGDVFRISFWCRGDGTNAPFYRAWATVGGNVITKRTTNVTGTEWTLVTHDYTAASDAYMYLYLYAGEADGAIAYFDDVSVKQYTPGTLNGGFEEWTDVTRTQLVSNSSFETLDGGADVWEDWDDTVGSGAIADTATTHTGSRAMQLTQGGSNDVQVGQSGVAGTAGEVFSLSFWTRVDSGDSAGRFGVTTAGGGWAVFQTSTGVTTTDYTKVTHNFIAPSGTTSLILRFYPSATNGDVAYFDDVELVQIPSNADDWTETVAGQSLVRRGDEPADVYAGTHSLILDVDSSNNNAQVVRAPLTTGKLYSYSVWAKAKTGTPTFYVSGGGVDPLELSAVFQEFTGSVISLYGYFAMMRAVAASNTIYIGSLTLSAAEIKAASDTNIWNDWIEDAQGNDIIALEAVDYFSLPCACRIENVDDGTSSIKQTVSASVRDYKLTMRTRGDGSVAGRYRVYAEGAAAWVNSLTSTGVTAAAYSKVSYEFTAPSGTTGLTVYLYAPATAGSAYFDDVRLQKA